MNRKQSVSGNQLEEEHCRYGKIKVRANADVIPKVVCIVKIRDARTSVRHFRALLVIHNR